MAARRGRLLPGAFALAAAVWLSSACTTGGGPMPVPPAQSPPATPTASAVLPAGPAGARGRVAGQHPAVLVYLPAEGDTLAAIAGRFLGDSSRAWVIEQANGDIGAPRAGQPLLLPLDAPSPLGVSTAGVQTVTVLCYHRFVAGDVPSQNKMQLPVARFEAQLAWLAGQRYTALRLADLQGFLDGRQAVPERSVVITADDGWESFYRHAFPLLKQYRMPATLFVYTDIIGTRDGLSWAQLREMAVSGWVDIQAHSKSHRNLTEPASGDSDAASRRALAAELRQPRTLLEGQLADVGVKVKHFAYPYGEVNEAVLAALNAESYALAFTVRAGGNAFYAAPRLLRRTMIYGDHTLEDFIQRVQTQRPLSKP